MQTGFGSGPFGARCRFRLSPKPDGCDEKAALVRELRRVRSGDLLKPYLGLSLRVGSLRVIAAVALASLLG
jgi:hypothetical protein